MGSNEEQISAIQPLNAIRTQQYAHSNHQTSTSNDKAVAHEQQRARYAQRAIASYNRIEHSQYGQELVNRIELAV